MELLIDFVNVKQWDCEALHGIAAKMGAKKPWVWSWPDVASELKLRFPARVRRQLPKTERLDILGDGARDMRVWTTESYADSLQPTDDVEGIVMPSTGFFEYLSELAAMWRWIVEQTKDAGPTVTVLNYIVSTSLRLSFGEDENPWAPSLSNLGWGASIVEHKLASAYVTPFIRGNGEAYKRIRTCNDPDCGRLFIYNRPKQTFCNDECRFHFHNVVKTRSGYMAEHQRRGRKENPAVYVRK